jgi:hypothetical protein
MGSVADRLGGAGLEWLGHYPSAGLRATRRTACTWSSGRLEAGVVEPAEVGRQRVDPAAGGVQQQAELVQPDPAWRWLLLGDDIHDTQRPAGPRPTGLAREGRARWTGQVDNLPNGSQA